MNNIRTTETFLRSEIQKYINFGYGIESACNQVDKLHLQKYTSKINIIKANLLSDAEAVKAKVFYEGQQLSDRSICNSDCVFTGEVIKRTEKTVTVKTDTYGVKRCKVHHDKNGNEFIYPHGRYSMCAVFKA